MLLPPLIISSRNRNTQVTKCSGTCKGQLCHNQWSTECAKTYNKTSWVVLLNILMKWQEISTLEFQAIFRNDNDMTSSHILNMLQPLWMTRCRLPRLPSRHVYQRVNLTPTSDVLSFHLGSTLILILTSTWHQKGLYLRWPAALSANDVTVNSEQASCFGAKKKRALSGRNTGFGFG